MITRETIAELTGTASTPAQNLTLPRQSTGVFAPCRKAGDINTAQVDGSRDAHPRTRCPRTLMGCVAAYTPGGSFGSQEARMPSAHAICLGCFPRHLPRTLIKRRHSILPTGCCFNQAGTPAPHVPRSENGARRIRAGTHPQNLPYRYPFANISIAARAPKIHASTPTDDALVLEQA